MKTINWLRGIIESGLLCEEYTELVSKAKGKKALFDIVCDSNGVRFLCEMRAKGFPLDYEVIQEEFGRYINGRCKPEYETPLTNGKYTSALYCGVNNNDVETLVDTTLACFLSCEGVVRIAPYNVARICLDTNSKIKLIVPPSSKVYVELWGEASITTTKEERERVTIKVFG